ncbi:porin [Rhodobium gokarnense]|uniref:Porin n=1 Tax=Rhodobium gokarnense TaxID=364296 RepID=A0ABT3HG26_9HYPH|nr:porin [Rhodobium gokarnense]MCW2309356.1 hypothetical protein [Rhodobium gokarnense]
MKIKSLLLGAAGALAITGAQAADLPVAPEPVDYVRVCDAFGTGFFYIPGTETCLRVGGRIRADYYVWGTDVTYDRSANALGVFGSARGRNNNYSSTRARAYLRLDSRTNTEFGLLRTYAQVYWTADSYGGTNTTMDYGFIQWGGLTAGRTDSFFQFYTGATYEKLDNSFQDSDTNVLAYTAAFGNGFSASISVEDGTYSRRGVLNGRWSRFVSATGAIPAGVPMDAYGGHWWPDLVANLNVSQGWGSAQVMAALHDVRDGIGGRDDSELGWAVGAGVIFNLPMIAAGDTIALQAAYADGATSYVAPSTNGWRTAYDAARRLGGTFVTTQAWSIGGGITHYWMPNLSSGLTVTYADFDQWDGICVAPRRGCGDFQEWDIQGNLVWSPASGFEIGVEVDYEYVEPDVGDEHDDVVGLLRFQRTF